MFNRELGSSLQTFYEVAKKEIKEAGGAPKFFGGSKGYTQKFNAAARSESKTLPIEILIYIADRIKFDDVVLLDTFFARLNNSDKLEESLEAHKWLKTNVSIYKEYRTYIRNQVLARAWDLGV
mgnify:CR=1 FL=1